MLKKFGFAFALVVSLAGFSGCLKSDDNNCNYNECATVAPASQIQAVKDYLASKGITGATQHCSGLFYIVDNPGTGRTPTACSNVKARYEGSFTSGAVFDNGNGNEVAFSLQQVINGWRAGIPLVKAGGRIRLFVPPALGYGIQDYGPIPGGSILISDVQLTEVN